MMSNSCRRSRRPNSQYLARHCRLEIPYIQYEAESFFGLFLELLFLQCLFGLLMLLPVALSIGGREHLFIHPIIFIVLSSIFLAAVFVVIHSRRGRPSVHD